MPPYSPGLDPITPRTVFNRAINPNGLIDQKNEGAAATTSGSLVQGPDMWTVNSTAAAGTFSIQREITNGQANILLTVITPDAALAAADIYFVRNGIEGYNIADLRFGTADAEDFIVSFEIMCNFTGTLPFSLKNSNQDRSYVSAVSIPQIDTWHEISIQVRADQTGTWNLTNGLGLRLSPVSLGGSNLEAGSLDTWLAGNFISFSGATNWMATAGNTIRIRKLNVTKGTFGQAFVDRSYGEELLLCQRYFQKSFPPGTAPANDAATSASQYNIQNITNNGVNDFIHPLVILPVPMRTDPTVTIYNSVTVATDGRIGIVTGAGTFTESGAVTIDAMNPLSFSGYALDGGSGFGAGAGVLAAYYWAASAIL